MLEVPILEPGPRPSIPLSVTMTSHHGPPLGGVWQTTRPGSREEGMSLALCTAMSASPEATRWFRSSTNIPVLDILCSGVFLSTSPWLSRPTISHWCPSSSRTESTSLVCSMARLLLLVATLTLTPPLVSVPL